MTPVDKEVTIHRKASDIGNFASLSIADLLMRSESWTPDSPIIEFSNQLAYSFALGARPWVYLPDTSEEPTALPIIGGLRIGRLRKDFILTSMHDISPSSRFWESLHEFISKQGITSCRITSISKSPPEILQSPFGREVEKYKHIRLYIANLEKKDKERHLSSNHKRNIAKATKAGVQFIEHDKPYGLEAHFRLTSASVARRSLRGESIALQTTRDHVIKLLQSGKAQLYQATLDNEVLSSKIVYRLGSYAFYYDGGTSPQGMSLGASHFLMAEIMDSLTKQGVKRLNIGLADENSGELWRFKKGFDTELWFANNLVIDCSAWHKLAINAIKSILVKNRAETVPYRR